MALNDASRWAGARALRPLRAPPGDICDRPYGQGQTTGGDLRANDSLRLHAVPAQVCAEKETEKKVKVNRARPAPGDPGAALCAIMTNEIMPLATRASIRHEAQV